MSQQKLLPTIEQKHQRRMLAVRYLLGHGTLKASVMFGISPRTLRSWRKRFEEGGLEGLKDRSRAAKRVWNKKDESGVLKRALLRLHNREPGLNKMQVFTKLLQEDTPEIATMSWISRARKELGLVKKKKVKENKHTLRYEIKTPGALQIDTKHVPKENCKDDKLYQFTAIDESTRVRFLGGSLFKSAKAAREFLVQAIAFYKSIGINVWRVQTDNGTEFTLPNTNSVQERYVKGLTETHVFTAECERRGIRHRLIKKASPELNGKVERSHRIDGEWFYARYNFVNEYELDHALKNIWMPEYNERRPHGSLNNKTPMDFLEGKLKKQCNIAEKKIAA